MGLRRFQASALYRPVRLAPLVLGVLGGVGLSLLGACGDSTGSGETATAAVAVAGTQWTQVNAGAQVSSVASIQPAIKVTDKSGNGVANVRVAVQITGGGTVQHASPTTNSSGVASVGTWTLGPTVGTQSVTLTVSGVASVVFQIPTVGTYNVDLKYVGALPDTAIRNAFSAAALRVSQIITTKLTPVNTNQGPAYFCDIPELPTQFDGTIQNVAIYVQVIPIDGVGQVLGQSGPCGVRQSTGLPFVGIMQFDSADLAQMVTEGTIDDVILHEMQHVLGFGTLWQGSPFPRVLLQGASTSNPVYLGASARTQYVAAGGTAPTGVPVEGGNVEGTSDAHWRQSTFQNELMTGYLTGIVHPFSKISIAALEDLGYTITYVTADQYFVPPPGALRAGPPVTASAGVREGLFKPKFAVDERTGRVNRLR